ncbi:hypothetical protein TRFO_28068 [Tritrichomonas foetus]|uniref:Uncharacterized protein n=1 Tax=Tritrichomonas foetus TaxID=1144522 RepID=A0A1J4K3P6_9EUKA|nr:hypothetical protein TRFO_28068 [Tritrichomonas foetus]|eukprot:OHT04372.1 hypothetical protein TRFO_28068 [Tritrichomonas foetus]
MYSLHFILDGIKNRAFQIGCEIALLKDQAEFMSTLSGIDPHVIDKLIFKIQVMTAVYKLYGAYLENMKAYSTAQSGMIPFKKVMQFHYVVLMNIKSKIIKAAEEIEGHQIALQELLNITLENYGDTIEDLLEALFYLFPYVPLLRLLLDSNKFFTELIKISIQYSPKPKEQHRESLKSVFTLLKSCEIGKIDQQATLAISEILLSIFTFRISKGRFSNNLTCFQFSERCKLLVQNHLAPLAINQEFIEHIEKNLTRNSEPVQKVPFEEMPKFLDCNIDLPLEYDNDTKSPIPCIHHIVLELRKLAIQPSISMMNLVLLRTMTLLNEAICTQGEIVGADESFQFFVAALSDARLYHLPTILEMLEKYLVPDLKTAKLQFLAAQLRIAFEFIQARPLQVPPYLLFPFKKCLIENLELHNEDPVELTGFVIYAYPTYKKKPIPAVLKCTGENSNKALMYRYIMSNTKSVLTHFKREVQTVATTHGFILYEERKDYSKMIEINNQSFVESIPEVEEISNLMIMLPQNMLKPPIQVLKMKEYEQQFIKIWQPYVSKNEKYPSRAIIEQIQFYIKDKHGNGKNGEIFEINGVLSKENIEVIKQMDIKIKGRFYIDPRIFQFLKSNSNSP